MGIYDSARAKTKRSITETFWNLYLQKDISKITVRDITEGTGIHRATFYLYYDNVFAVLDSIKQEQLDKLGEVCSTYASAENDYADFLGAMRKLYDENEIFLKPLLCQYRGNEFAAQYRQIMKNKLRNDIGWRQYPDGSKPFLVVDSVLSGLIEIFISFLQTRAFSLESAYKFASYSVDHGLAPAMEHEFGISLLPEKSD